MLPILHSDPAADTTYIYDAIGNLIADRSEGVTISWTSYGKIRQVNKGDSITITYRYDATGNRTEKEVTKDDSVVTTHYVRDASGNVMAIYSNTALIEQPIYGSSRVGLYRGNIKTAHRTLGKKNYELSNHLGNILNVITDNVRMENDSVWATVASTSDYYPFGLGMEGRSWSDSTMYRYRFNGKEKDSFGSVVYDYGFRVYNPKTAKFLSVDPLTKSYPWYTPYQFAGNKPIAAIDLDGAEEKIVIHWYNDNYEIYRTKIINPTGQGGHHQMNQLWKAMNDLNNVSSIKMEGFEIRGNGRILLAMTLHMKKDIPPEAECGEHH